MNSTTSGWLVLNRPQVAGFELPGDKSAETLLELVVRRHQNRSTLMTSNRPIEEWGQLLGDVPAATAILDRFLQQAEIIQITGRSYRLRHPLKPSEDQKPPANEKKNGGNAERKR